MDNFAFQNPVKILFGRGQTAAIESEIPADARILMTFGGGSIKSNGVYEQAIKALAGRKVLEYGGIEANPRYETLMPAVEIVRKEKIDFLLSVGGGSVLDGTKFIAAAAPFVGEPWDILSKKAPVQSAIAIGSIMTLPATGSEMNTFSVVSRNSTNEKLAFSSPHVFPKFSVLDPETTFSLPPRQIANGIVDAFTHTMEQYLTYPANAPLQDRMAEGILKTLIEEGPKTLANPHDYDSRANIVWSATMALNGLIGQGVPQDWATHMIGHELTALHNIDHARTLAIVMPSLLRVRKAGKRAKLLQFAERVWEIRTGSEDERIEAGIAAMEAFFRAVGVPTKLSAHGVGREVAEVVAGRLRERGMVALGERQDITPETVVEILGMSA